jgi:hypothetical protein
MRVAIADIDEEKLKTAGKELVALIGEANVLVIPTDVVQLDQVINLRDKVYETWGEVRRTLSTSVPTQIPHALSSPRNPTFSPISTWAYTHAVYLSPFRYPSC